MLNSHASAHLDVHLMQILRHWHIAMLEIDTDWISSIAM